ncbi:MAG: 2,3-bisphosphoglycerate-independent phosphoglycerate mutase [Bacteroidia bacterium]
MSKKVVLVILDGWGIGDKSKSDAIAHSKKPFFDSLIAKYPKATLLTCGEHVGLPDGQMGNSEVGHLNIGAGRIVYQDLVKINLAIRDKSMEQNEALNNALNYVKTSGKKLHLMGLVSDGGVHSSQEHLHALCDIAKERGIDKVFIHAFTDGRDTDPKSAYGFIEKLEKHLKNSSGKIASVVGRYYAMDRDKRWERVKLAYDLLVHGVGEKHTHALEAIQHSYNNGVTDEFIKPVVIVDEQKNPIAKIEDGDAVICFNFRTDRCREITMALTQQAFHEYNMHPLQLHYVTMTNYDATFKNVHVMFDKDNLSMTLGEVLAKANKKQIRIAETEKYPHVTFFFSGGREKEFENEKRILIPSPKVATYDLQPEMSAQQIVDAIIPELKNKWPDFVCLNFANPDMVGHTGVYEAIQKAIETVDSCLKQIVECGLENAYSFVIIADHGNADVAINPDGTPNTAHSLNPVPIIVIDKDVKNVKNGILADVAPSILHIMNISQPKEMTGKSLVN